MSSDVFFSNFPAETTAMRFAYDFISRRTLRTSRAGHSEPAQIIFDSLTYEQKKKIGGERRGRAMMTTALAGLVARGIVDATGRNYSLGENAPQPTNSREGRRSPQLV